MTDEYEKRLSSLKESVEHSRITGVFERVEKPVIKGNVALAVAPCKDTEDFVKTLASQIPNVERIGYIDGNAKGYCEVYFEMPNYEEARKLAIRIHMIPGPVRGVHFTDDNFDDVIKDTTFKAMRGKVTDKTELGL